MTDPDGPAGNYLCTEIQVIGGLEAIRKRPGMYLSLAGLDPKSTVTPCRLIGEVIRVAREQTNCRHFWVETFKSGWIAISSDTGEDLVDTPWESPDFEALFTDVSMTTPYGAAPSLPLIVALSSVFSFTNQSSDGSITEWEYQRDAKTTSSSVRTETNPRTGQGHFKVSFLLDSSAFKHTLPLGEHLADLVEHFAEQHATILELDLNRDSPSV